jgi:hypothetical protein
VATLQPLGLRPVTAVAPAGQGGATAPGGSVQNEWQNEHFIDFLHSTKSELLSQITVNSIDDSNLVNIRNFC